MTKLKTKQRQAKIQIAENALLFMKRLNVLTAVIKVYISLVFMKQQPGINSGYKL